jgi:hypothetical protein
MAEDTLLDRAADFAYAELRRVGEDPSKLEIPLQTVAVLYHVQGMIDNGGFRYLFENDLAFCPPYTLISDAYRRIGAAKAADCLDRAVGMFPFENPHLFSKQRNDFMDSLNESHEMFALGYQVCGDETVWSDLEAYAHRNAAFFQVM